MLNNKIFTKQFKNVSNENLISKEPSGHAIYVCPKCRALFQSKVNDTQHLFYWTGIHPTDWTTQIVTEAAARKIRIRCFYCTCPEHKARVHSISYLHHLVCLNFYEFENNCLQGQENCDINKTLDATTTKEQDMAEKRLDERAVELLVQGISKEVEALEIRMPIVSAIEKELEGEMPNLHKLQTYELLKLYKKICS